MEYELTIPGQLTGLNEYIAAERTNRYNAAKLKRKNEDIIATAIKQQLRGIEVKSPVEMHYLWVEPDRRRDRDNIAFAKKFVQDALVNAGVLRDDGWNHVVGFSDRFGVDKINPRIEVLIKEVAENI